MVAAPISRISACVISVLAFATAIGAGHLAAGLLTPVSSPFTAVADLVVRIAPNWLVDFGKTVTVPGLGVGKADKVGLLVGEAIILLVIAVLAGLASRYSEVPARRVLLTVGMIGLIAVCTSPVFTLRDVAAPLIAVGAGLRTFRWLHRKATTLAQQPLQESGTSVEQFVRPDDSAARPPAGPSGGQGGSRDLVSRRDMLVSGTVVGLGATSAGLIGSLIGAGVNVDQSRIDLTPRLRPKAPAPPIPPDADFASYGTPKFLTTNADFYRIDTALSIPKITANKWLMRIHGMVDRELTIRYADLLARPLVERTVTLTCVSNVVGGGLISTANFVGVDLRQLLLDAGVRPGAEQIFSTSLDGWTAGTPVSVVMEPNRGAMLALAMNGEPLPWEHGFPVRMVVPGLYGYVSATKWLSDLEITTFNAKQPYWRKRGWSEFGPIKTESRIDKPMDLDRVHAGRIAVAGIAWAQHRGVSKVEVRIDGGPWQPAQLSTEVNADTWRMWRAFPTVGPGNHVVESRATDGSGTPQTAKEAATVPDGASGYPINNFSAI